jgi:hypothetical protein
MSGQTLNWKSGDDNDLAARVAQLQTFVRMLEKEIATLDPSAQRDRLLKNEHRLDSLDRRIDKLDAAVEELDDLKATARVLNPKMVAGIVTLIMGGSMAGNTALDSMTGVDHQQKIDQQDERLDRIMKRLDSDDD